MSWSETTGLALGNCLETFGEQIFYMPKAQPSVVMTGIFDDLYESVDPNTLSVITSQQPIVGIRDSDLGQTPRQDDQVLVRGILYRVKEVQTDGQSGSKLYLHKVG